MPAYFARFALLRARLCKLLLTGFAARAIRRHRRREGMSSESSRHRRYTAGNDRHRLPRSARALHNAAWIVGRIGDCFPAGNSECSGGNLESPVDSWESPGGRIGDCFPAGNSECSGGNLESPVDSWESPVDRIEGCSPGGNSASPGDSWESPDGKTWALPGTACFQNCGLIPGES